MIAGIISALALLMTLFLESTFMNALPSPWREIPLPLIFGIIVMYRISLPLGAAMLFAAGLLSLMHGLATPILLASYAVAAIVGVALSSRVFARRSLAALGGFALLTASSFIFSRFLFLLMRNILERSPLFMGTSFSHMVFVLFAVTMGSVVLSLGVNMFERSLGRRFMQKEASYEIGRRI